MSASATNRDKRRGDEPAEAQGTTPAPEQDETIRANLKKAGLSEGSDLTAEQRERALTAPKGLSRKRLEQFIKTGKTDDAAKAESTGTKPASKTAGSNGGDGDKPAATAEKSEPAEQDSVPMYTEAQTKSLTGGGYAAYAILESGDLHFIGLFSGSTRQKMAGEARAAYAKQRGVGKEKAANSEIVSVRPNNIRKTPALSR